MDKNSKSNFIKHLETVVGKGKIPSRLGKVIKEFYESYKASIPSNGELDQLFTSFTNEIAEQCKNPYPFEPYHKHIREPYDYYAFGLEFLRPLIDKEKSTFLGKEHLPEIEKHLEQNHNVVFLANHQTEADPQLISLFLENDYPKLAEDMIFVAGERVITDPLAIPFSMGCNLLCIYSKRYIDHPPEKKLEKQLHNKKTMGIMTDLLKEGGKCIYVAPSGGRDRRNESNEVEIASFDPASIGMFYLMAKKSRTPTFFYPMALGTYKVLPPPEKIQVELGEIRRAKKSPVHIAIGKQIDMEHFPGHENSDKHLRRKYLSEYIWNLVHQDYQRFPKG